MPRILIVEDDPSIRFGLEEVLGAEGHEVVSCARGDSVVEESLKKRPADLIILDVMMPGRSGYDCCRDLREAGVRVPILMLTARSQEMDKVTGLECGADDYVTKPFGLKELCARVQALLRRAGEFNRGEVAVQSTAEGCFNIGDAEIDPAQHTVSRGGKSEALTPRECALAVYLHRHRGQLLSRDQLLQEVWGVSYFGTTRTLDQTIAQLRKKTGDTAPRWLLTVHGVGYRLAAE